MTFRFRKLYADAVTPDGTVVVAYLTWLEVAGTRFAAAGIERYGPAGGRVVRRARPPAWGFDPDRVGEGFDLRLELPEGQVAMRYESVLPPWTPPGPAPTDAMEWRVLVPRARVVVSTAGLDGPVASGYCDWVELRRPPRWLGLRRLRWGRAHLPEGTAVFTALTFGSGRVWNRTAWWNGRDPQPDEGGGAVEVGEGVEVGGLCIRSPGALAATLRASRLLHDGQGLDRERFPSAGTRFMARVLTGSLHEQRWLAGGPGCALHETVCFGGPGGLGR